MMSTAKEQFFAYFQRRLENLKQLAALQPSQNASFEPEQNILAGAEIDALARYWAIYEGRTFQRAVDRMAEFLATHGDAKIWNKCSHTDLRERVASLKTDVQRKALEKTLTRLLPQSAAMVEGMPGWQDDPDFATLQQDAAFQNAGVPKKFLADSRYGATLYRSYRCAWVHELNSDSRLPTDEPIPKDLMAEVLGQEQGEPYYMLRNGVRRLHIPTLFIVQSFERAIDSFEQSVPDGAIIALR